MDNALHPELQKLIDIEKIKQLKYAYMRHLDLKQWDEMALLFTDNVVSSYSDGKYSFNDKAGLIGFLRTSLSDPHICTMHHAHHPEITVSDNLLSASATWYLQDKVINPGSDKMPGFTLNGTGIYHDEYVKLNGEWKISVIGYQRVYEEILSRDSFKVLSFRSRFMPAA